MAQSDSELLAATVAGDEDAYARFYQRHLGVILAWFLRRTGNRELAADLAAEVFAAALLAAPRFDPGQGSGAGWLFGIAQNKLRDSLRRGRVEDAARRRLALEPMELTDSDLELVERRASDADAGLARLMEELPPEQREAITARVIDERGYEEIAAALRCSESVVRKRVSRGLARLRSRLVEERR